MTIEEFDNYLDDTLRILWKELGIEGNYAAMGATRAVIHNAALKMADERERAGRIDELSLLIAGGALFTDESELISYCEDREATLSQHKAAGKETDK